MKKYLYQMLAIIALFIVGCGDDCKDVDCGPGTCDEGTCICPDGYEGASCEILENAIYFGSFIITEGSCDLGGFIGLESVNIAAKPEGEAFDVRLALAGPGTEVSIMDGTIMDGKLDVSGFYGGFNATLKGEFSNDVSSFAGILDVEGLTTCNITMMK